MSAPITPGDVVRLKSGGPWMTVTGGSVEVSDHVTCVWIADNGEHYSRAYPCIALKLVPVPTAGSPPPTVTINNISEVDASPVVKRAVGPRAAAAAYSAARGIDPAASMFKVPATTEPAPGPTIVDETLAAISDLTAGILPAARPTKDVDGLVIISEYVPIALQPPAPWGPACMPANWAPLDAPGGLVMFSEPTPAPDYDYPAWSRAALGMDPAAVDAIFYNYVKPAPGSGDSDNYYPLDTEEVTPIMVADEIDRHLAARAKAEP